MSDADSDNEDKNDSLDPLAGMGERAAKAADEMIAEQRAKLEEEESS
ncbi:MAG TPA: hypothetical protein VHB51_03765 [Candidatus Saccharimonadales bacterium]|nr:hypothetical protein [Candidatus Saccharimonadales bacterium]